MLDDQTNGVTTMAATDSHRTEPVTVSPTPRVSFGSVNDSFFLKNRYLFAPFNTLKHKSIRLLS